MDASFYYIVWAILLVLALWERASKHPFGKGFVAVIFVLVAVVVGCRNNVGADWNSYVKSYYLGMFYDESKGTERSIEPIYMICQQFFHSLGFTHAIFFMFLSLLSLSCYYKATKLIGIKYFMTVFLVYFSLVFLNYQFNVIRQGMMASFVWLAFAYKTVGNIRASVISIVIALGFHYTAIAFIPFIFIADKLFSIKVVFIIIGVSFASLLLDVSYRILSLFPLLETLERTSNFVTSETFHVETGLTFGMMLMLLIFFVVYHYFRNDYNNDSRLRMLTNIILFDFLLSCMFNSFSIFQERVCRVLFFSLVFLLPLMIEKMRKPLFRGIAVTVVILYAFISFPKTFAVHDGYSTLLPYQIDLSQIFEGYNKY